MKKLLLLSLIFVSGCTIYSKERGFLFPDDLDSIISKSKTKSDLSEYLGNPSAQSSLGQDLWIYYGYTENFNGPFPHTYDNKKALIVYFDNKGKILSSRKLNDSDFEDIVINEKFTSIPGSVELNFFEELVGNVGRFTPNMGN